VLTRKKKKKQQTFSEQIKLPNLLHLIKKNTWDEHIYSTEKVINRKLALLRRIKCFLPLNARKLFFNTHVLHYCSIIWGNSAHANRLLLTQKRAARIILDITDLQYPSNDMFKQLQWMPFSDRTTYRKATMVLNV
jgi:hypothetical protein